MKFKNEEDKMKEISFHIFIVILLLDFFFFRLWRAMCASAAATTARCDCRFDVNKKEMKANTKIYVQLTLPRQKPRSRAQADQVFHFRSLASANTLTTHGRWRLLCMNKIFFFTALSLTHSLVSISSGFAYICNFQVLRIEKKYVIR